MEEKRTRLMPRMAGVVTIGVVAAALLASGSSQATIPGLDLTVTKANDANHDGVFNATENVPKNVTYPWSVTYQLSIFGGSRPGPYSDANGPYRIIRSISDSNTSNLGSCQALVGTKIYQNQTETCTYTVTLTGPGSAPLVNNVSVVYDNAGGDVSTSSSTVNFPAMSLTKSSTTAFVTSAGQVVPYTYVITDTGTSSLSGITLSDDNTDAPPACPSTTLTPGNSMTCTAQHTVTQAEIAAGGNLVNHATATSNEAPNAYASYSIPIAQAPPGGGSFVIGDQNAAVGTSVTFWGAQWWKLNSLSGGTAPASFKGFEDTPPSPSCGTGWSTDPGNSTPPPAGPLPTYMVIVVSSTISKSGSTISGDTEHLVVVKTNSGYAPNPGHAGTGTVVYTIC